MSRDYKVYYGPALMCPAVPIIRGTEVKICPVCPRSTGRFGKFCVDCGAELKMKSFPTDGWKNPCEFVGDDTFLHVPRSCLNHTLDGKEVLVPNLSSSPYGDFIDPEYDELGTCVESVSTSEGKIWIRHRYATEISILEREFGTCHAFWGLFIWSS